MRGTLRTVQSRVGRPVRLGNGTIRPWPKAAGCGAWGLWKGGRRLRTLSLIESRGLRVRMEGGQVSRVAMEEIVR